MIGKVSLVGSGPGDIELLTLKAYRRLQEANVVLYDNLTSSQIVASLPRTTLAISVGKRPAGGGKPVIEQSVINQMMIDYAKQGKDVVRLKGGDPGVFAHGAEEIEALLKEGISVEVIPGISSFLAAAACCGISLTHRMHSSGFMVVTGHEDPKKAQTSINWPLIAGNIHSGMTLVVLMGVRTINGISQTLIQHKVDKSLPVAVIYKASQPDERTFISTLGSVAEDVKRQGVFAPCIFIIGKVVDYHSLNSFPLAIDALDEIFV